MYDLFAVLRPSRILNETVKGDVNQDGIVNKKDAQILAKYIIDKKTSVLNILLGDMNDDGKIKMNDVIKLID